jgi:DNA primase
MTLCPFHNDHHPSLKLDKRYYCFACGASGDVIDFTAKFFGVSVHSAAIKLARDFGIDPRPPTQLHIPIPDAEPFREEELPCIFSLS